MKFRRLKQNLIFSFSLQPPSGSEISQRHRLRLFIGCFVVQFRTRRTVEHRFLIGCEGAFQCRHCSHLHSRHQYCIGQRHGAFIQGTPALVTGKYKGYTYPLCVVIAAQHCLSITQNELYAHSVRYLPQAGWFPARTSRHGRSWCKLDWIKSTLNVFFFFLYENFIFIKETIDVAASCAFAVGLAAFNMLLYLFPMPRCVKQKFKDWKLAGKLETYCSFCSIVLRFWVKLNNIIISINNKCT